MRTSMNWEEFSYLLWSRRAVFMWESSCVACKSLMFLAWVLFLALVPATSFLGVCCPLKGMWLVSWWIQPALDVECGLLFVVFMALVGENSAPQLLELKPSVSEMWPVLGGLGEKPLSIPLLDLSIREYTLWCYLLPTVLAYRVHCSWHCSWPCLNCGDAGYQPGCPSGAVLTKSAVQICHHRYSEVRHQDCCHHIPGPAMEAVESAQIPGPTSVCKYPQHSQLLASDPP